MKSDLYSGVQHKQINESKFILQPQEIGGNKMRVSLLFNKKKVIYMVNASIIMEESKSWDTWSEQQEFKRKEEHDRLLETMLGTTPPYKYSWGEVSSKYDPLSDSSMINIGYY